LYNVNVFADTFSCNRNDIMLVVKVTMPKSSHLQHLDKEI